MLPDVPKEILYVQKLHFLAFLLSLILVASLSISIILSTVVGLLTLLLGMLVAYGVTIKKQNFLTPTKESITRHLAKSLTKQNLEPSAAARAATELFYLLGDRDRAEKLLQAYLASGNPLVHSALADIYLTEHKLQDALNCLEPVKTSDNPLVEWTYGRIFMEQGDYPSALQHLNKAKILYQRHGLPSSTTGLLNSKFMQLSIKASIHHKLAECHYNLGNVNQAKQFLWYGNRYIIDLSLWRSNF